MNILFYTTAIEHSTFRKVARMLDKEGANVKMIGFTRNNFPASKEEFEIECLGTISHGGYLKRMLTLFKTFVKLREESGKNDVLYCFTLDTLILIQLSNLFRKKKVVYQIQDIRTIFFHKGLKGKVVKFLESIFIKKVDLLVVSSIYFYEYHFKVLYKFPKEKVFVVENKLLKEEHNFFKEERNIFQKIVLGYFGVLRCQRSWDIIKEAATRYEDKICVYMRGKVSGIKNFENDLSALKNVSYEGAYTSPDDLADIYSKVDIVWAAYPFSSNETSGNWTMARTIRYYESGAFHKPMIVQKGTIDSLEVSKYNIGAIIDMSNIDDTIVYLGNILNEEQIDIWSNNLKLCDESLFYHKNEYRLLLNRIDNINE